MAAKAMQRRKFFNKLLFPRGKTFSPSIRRLKQLLWTLFASANPFVSNHVKHKSFQRTIYFLDCFKKRHSFWAKVWNFIRNYISVISNNIHICNVCKDWRKLFKVDIIPKISKSRGSSPSSGKISSSFGYSFP